MDRKSWTERFGSIDVDYIILGVVAGFVLGEISGMRGCVQDIMRNVQPPENTRTLYPDETLGGLGVEYDNAQR